MVNCPKFVTKLVISDGKVGDFFCKRHILMGYYD